jgi:hypothetical protein
MTDEAPLPDIARAIGPLLERVPREHRALLVAIAERMAAARYRSWAGEPSLAAHADALSACADREETIARRVETLNADAGRIQQALRDAHPELETLNAEFFAGHSLADQLTLQARAERLGAATWRAFAKEEGDAEAREAFLACAELEEASAEVLESIPAPPATP